MSVQEEESVVVDETVPLDPVAAGGGGEGDCAVCLEAKGGAFRPATLLPCGHDFCRLCVIALLERSKAGMACPLCRRATTRAEVLDALEEDDRTGFAQAALTQGLCVLLFAAVAVGLVTASAYAAGGFFSFLFVFAAMGGGACGVGCGFLPFFPALRFAHPSNVIWMVSAFFLSPVLVVASMAGISTASFGSGGPEVIPQALTSMGIALVVLTPCCILPMCVSSWVPRVRGWWQSDMIEKNVMGMREIKIFLGISGVYACLYIPYVVILIWSAIIAAP